MYITDYSTITFKRNPTVTLTNNLATNGGAVYIDNYSTVTFKENSTVRFVHNCGANS